MNVKRERKIHTHTQQQKQMDENKCAQAMQLQQFQCE